MALHSQLVMTIHSFIGKGGIGTSGVMFEIIIFILIHHYFF